MAQNLVEKIAQRYAFGLDTERLLLPRGGMGIHTRGALGSIGSAFAVH